MRDPRSQLAFALDYPNLEQAEAGARQVAPYVGVLKVGLELFIKEGSAAITMAHNLGCEVFLDLKLHDIPKTVERAVRAAVKWKVRYLTIHTQGGRTMMEAAAGAAAGSGALTVLGVTVLTSLTEQDLAEVGIDKTPQDHALRLSRLAQACKLGGLVCSAQEVASLRQAMGPEMVLCTPGIRPAGTDQGDQKRIATPADAIKGGSNLLVVGRPIRDAVDPAQAACSILQSIAETS